jgi:hypothetical protein
MYTVVKEYDLLILIDVVNDMIADGYSPIGGLNTIFTDYADNGRVVYLQAMIKN